MVSSMLLELPWPKLWTNTYKLEIERKENPIGEKWPNRNGRNEICTLQHRLKEDLPFPSSLPLSLFPLLPPLFLRNESIIGAANGDC